MTSRLLVIVALATALDPCSKLEQQLKGNTAASAATATTPAPPPQTLTAEDLEMREAKDLCAKGDCETAHKRLALALPSNSPVRQQADFKDLENKWAQQAIAGAANDPDVLGRRKELAEVLASPIVDPALKTKAQATLQAMPTKGPPDPVFTADPSRDGGAPSIGDQARALQSSDPAAAKKLLLPRVSSGKASRDEIELLKSICKGLRDNACVDLCNKKLR